MAYLPALLALLVGLLAHAEAYQPIISPKTPKPNRLIKYYTAWPAPIPVRKYAKSLFTCEGRYALCSYATCVVIPNSIPPTAECGCYNFKNRNLGAGPGVLKKSLQEQVMKACPRGGAKCVNQVNSSPFCKQMNDNTMYPGYKLISTYNPNDWAVATNASSEFLKPKWCNGGTFTNCFSAACRNRAPQFGIVAPTGFPPYNATCYCPYTTLKKRRFLMGSQSSPCGPTTRKELLADPTTLIYNGL